MRQKIISKNEIINQALKIIQEEGIKSCSVRRVAKDLNIAVGTVYNYFNSREAFIIEAFEKSWNKTISKLENLTFKYNNNYDCLLDFFELIADDVKKRNDLGVELLQINENTAHYYFKKVNISLEKIIRKIVLNNSVGSEREDALIRWICLILLDSIKNKTNLNDGDKELLKELITNIK